MSDIDLVSVMLCFQCERCPTNRVPVVHSGVDLGSVIITEGGPVISHLLEQHYINGFGESDNLLSLAGYGITSWVLSPNNDCFESISIKESFLWKCDAVEVALSNIMSCTCGVKLSSCSVSDDYIKAFSHFILLEKTHFKGNTICEIENNPQIGQEVITGYTPFNTISLFNSWSRGGICNVINDCVALVDVRLTPGCEGAPVFLNKEDNKKSLIGLIVTNIAYYNNDLTGFSFVALFWPVINSISQLNQTVSYKIDETPIGNLQNAQQSIVQINIGLTWGSGIIISEDGYILTSAHVINFGEINNKKVLVQIGNKHYNSEVIYSTKQGMSCELAILKMIDPPKCKPVKICDRNPCKGDKVYAIGYSLFSQAQKANVTSGIVSYISNHFITTTCLIHVGASGGALIDSSGQLLGIITCNIQYIFSFPYVNIIICTKSFDESLRTFLQTRDLTPLIEWSNNISLNAARLLSTQTIKIIQQKNKL